jgi:hypothetical protein
MEVEVPHPPPYPIRFVGAGRPFEVAVEEQTDDLADPIATVTGVSPLVARASQPCGQVVQQLGGRLWVDLLGQRLQKVAFANELRAIMAIGRIEARRRL